MSKESLEKNIEELNYNLEKIASCIKGLDSDTYCTLTKIAEKMEQINKHLDAIETTIYMK